LAALLLVAFTFVTLSATAMPVVKAGSVTMMQRGGVVTFGYELETEPGVVTVDIQTNGVSIGGQYLTDFSGDVNKLVGVGRHTFTWKPYKAWPGDNTVAGVTAVVTAWATNAPPDYMAVSLETAQTVRYYANAESVPFGVTNDMYKTDWLLMRKIPAANEAWRMGSPTNETGRYALREKARLVTLTNDFYIGVYPCTQRQYELIYGTRPSYFNNDAYYATRPVQSIKYNTLRGTAPTYDWPTTGFSVDSGSFFSLLRTHSGIQSFDLPGDAEWEFACRAGTGTAIYGSSLAAIARYGKDAGSDADTTKGTAAVGSYEPNAFGLYDMIGNIFEYCRDWFAETTQDFDSLTGATASSGNSTGNGCRIGRGGAYHRDASICRSAHRHPFSPGFGDPQCGFRVWCKAEAVK
jgi:formylglycine-generating enzyme required for sulfatase activity